MTFSLKNIDDAGFGLREGSKLESFLNRKLVPSHVETINELVNVWGSCGHVFVATNAGRNLHAFESIPRAKWTPESENLLLQDQESPIISVLSSNESPSLIFIIHQNSITECWEFTQSSYKWIKKNEFQLSNTKGVEILQVVLHPLVNCFFWCERRSVSASNLISCCVCVRQVIISERLGNNTVVSVGPLVAILHGCPPMSLHVISRNICLVPDFPEELRCFVLFWTFVQRSLKIYIWNYGFVGDVDKFDFKAIIAELLCPWTSSTKNNLHHLVALTSHPTTNELLVIDSGLELSLVKLQERSPDVAPLVRLQADSLIFHSDKILDLFAFGLIVGVLWKSGKLSLYDVGSGAEICKLEDFKGQKVLIWRCSHLVNSIGFWSVNGIWKLQSGTVLETADCIRSSVNSAKLVSRENNSFVTTQESIESFCSNSPSKSVFITDASLLKTELDTSSENFLIPEIVKNKQKSERSSVGSGQSRHIGVDGFSGPLFAVSHLTKWNLTHRAAKLALDSIVCSGILSGSPVTYSEIPESLVHLLVSSHSQGPEIALLLLWEDPVHREFVLRNLEQYMIERGMDKSHPKKTLLNELLHPYMSEFLLLNKQCKSATDPNVMEITQSPTLPTNSVMQEILTLLETFDSSPLEMVSLERLSTLSHQHPHKVLEHVADYLRIDFEEDESTESQWQGRWRKIYRLEWRSGRWGRSKLALKDPYNVMLSILLRMFFVSKSDWLMRSVEKGIGAMQVEESDYRSEEFVTQSVLECLPVLSTRHTNSKSVLVHSQLCYSAGQEIQALHLLLSHQMWKEAIDFVSHCGKGSENPNLLFIMLIKGFQSRKAPSKILIEALNLKPKDLSTDEILTILKDQAIGTKEPFAKAAGQTTVAEMRPFLDALFSKEV